MNALTETDAATDGMTGEGRDLMRDAVGVFQHYCDQTGSLRDALTRLTDIGDEATARAARKLAHQLGAVEPTVTMIGQVKAGKTTLVNALIGRPGFLPADINPWTSVVTSMHLSPTRAEDRAAFTFFDQNEWTRLMDKGGRMGELARRAGAEDEVDKVRQQITELREKTKARLGRKFELLLGQTHDYGYVDSALVERYVCLGDDFEADFETSSTKGRFADITKAADIRLHAPDLPMPLCIRDTPGVNDTFMMREQITIAALRDSRTCVVVLSAHQALSSVDMALIRLISNVKAREVVIFVNRIDELAAPTSEIAEIEASIRKTLKDQQGPEDAEIVFGSAYWANLALSGNLGDLTQASADALIDWGDSQLGERTRTDPIDQIVWELSGVPALFAALARRIEEGVGREALDRAAKSAINLAGGISASSEIVSFDHARPAEIMSEAEALKRYERVRAAALKTFGDRFDAVVADFHTRVDRATNSFLDRAVASLLDHLEGAGERKVWTYDPTGLRLLLRSAYTVFARKSQGAFDTTVKGVVELMTQVYVEGFALDRDAVRLQSPSAPRVPSPVLLGQTIALDIKGSWWKRWWQRRRGYDTYAGDFIEMIRAEIDPILTGLKDEHVGGVRVDAEAALARFLDEQREILVDVARRAAEGADAELGGQLAADRRAAIDETLATLTGFAA